MAESERGYVREKSLEGQAAEQEHGHHGGRTKGVEPQPQVAQKLRFSLRHSGVPSPGPGRQGVSCWCPVTESRASLLWLSVPGRVVSTTRVWARFSVYGSWASTSMRPSSGWRMVLQSS